MLFRVLLLLVMATVVTACDGEKAKEIEWQLPLSVPHDPHASSEGKQLPTWAKSMQGRATIVFLEKATARTFTVVLENGSQEEFNHWTIRLQGLAQGLRVKGNAFIHDDHVHNPAGFVSLHLHGAEMYEGWLYQDFPELFGMDNSHWKVWIKDVTMPLSSREDDNMLP